jgi:hypothetical protein
MGYRGLPMRKHSAWDPFRRPRGLDFRVCDFPDFLALTKKIIYRRARRLSLKVHVVWWQMLAGGFAVNAISHHGEL